MGMDASDESRHTDREPETDEGPVGGVVIGDLGGGAAAAGLRAKAKDTGRRIGRPGDAAGPPPVVAPVPGGVAVGRMTGGAVVSGTEAEAVDESEHLIEATPQLLDALRLLRGMEGELRTEAAEAEREIQETGGVRQGRLRRLAASAGRSAGSVGGQTAAAVAAEVITGMLP
jgi:hypothetical protein